MFAQLLLTIALLVALLATISEAFYGWGWGYPFYGYGFGYPYGGFGWGGWGGWWGR